MPAVSKLHPARIDAAVAVLARGGSEAEAARAAGVSAATFSRWAQRVPRLRELTGRASPAITIAGLPVLTTRDLEATPAVVRVWVEAAARIFEFQESEEP